MSNAMKKVRRFLAKKLKSQPKEIPFAWRTVEQGPLKNTSVYVPHNRSWGNDVVQNRYETEFISVMTEHVTTDGCLYDIGGHVGIFSLTWLMLGGEFVETFEPLPANASLIGEVMDRNDMKGRFQIHQLALGDISAEGTLVEHKSDSSRGQIAELDHINLDGYQHKEKLKPHTIQIESIDNLFAQNKLRPPTMMKIDVEGAEHNVLQGAFATIDQYRPIILTEIHNAQSGLETCAFLLENFNYTMKLLGGKGAKQSLPLVEWKPA